MTDLSGKTILVFRAPSLSGMIDGVIQTLKDAGAVVRILNADAASTDSEAFDAAIFCPDWFAEKPFLDTDAADWNEALAANFEQIVLAGQAAARRLIEQGNGGRIIYLSSVAALKPLANLSAMGVTLAALNALVKMAAVDLAPYGITVNIISLGWLEAGWMTATVQDAAQIARNIPAERLGSARDVGELCRFLISDQSGYLTGTVIPVDGGYTLTKAGAGTPRQS